MPSFNKFSFCNLEKLDLAMLSKGAMSLTVPSVHAPRFAIRTRKTVPPKIRTTSLTSPLVAHELRSALSRRILKRLLQLVLSSCPCPLLFPMRRNPLNGAQHLRRRARLLHVNFFFCYFFQANTIVLRFAACLEGLPGQSVNNAGTTVPDNGLPPPVAEDSDHSDSDTLPSARPLSPFCINA